MFSFIVRVAKRLATSAILPQLRVSHSTFLTASPKTPVLFCKSVLFVGYQFFLFPPETPFHPTSPVWDPSLVWYNPNWYEYKIDLNCQCLWTGLKETTLKFQMQINNERRQVMQIPVLLPRTVQGVRELERNCTYVYSLWDVGNSRRMPFYQRRDFFWNGRVFFKSKHRKRCVSPGLGANESTNIYYYFHNINWTRNLGAVM